MKTKWTFLLFMIVFFCSCHSDKKQDKQVIAELDNPLIGKWVRIGQNGPISFDFIETGLIEGDFGNDGTIDVVAKYELSGDTVKFIDKEGQMCQGIGQYKVYQTNYYVSFDLIDDDCSGRIKTTMGFWTKSDFDNILKELEKEISDSPKPDFYLNRARIYMAIGKPKQAKTDFDAYILNDTTNARAYINRAGTRFPDDLAGVVIDCNEAIALAPNNKNAYFLRGLARYELGEKELGCEDFSKAIELGFSVLKIAEQEKCIEFWDEKLLN
jgi:tetratricopeptide (TPR) repeat protein